MDIGLTRIDEDEIAKHRSDGAVAWSRGIVVMEESGRQIRYRAGRHRAAFRLDRLRPAACGAPAKSS